MTEKDYEGGFIVCDETQSNILQNKVYLSSVLENIWTMAYPIKINGEEFDDMSVEFAARYLNNPEKLNLILEENKSTILYSIADSEDKPRNVTPEEYYDALVVVTNVLYSESGHYVHNSDMYNGMYRSGDLRELCDSIVFYSILDMSNEGFWDEKIDEIGSEDDEILINQMKDHISYYYEDNKNIASKVLENLIKEWDAKIEENAPDFEDDEDKFVSYMFLFRGCCSPEYLYSDIEDFYGEDYSEMISRLEEEEDIER